MAPSLMVIESPEAMSIYMLGAICGSAQSMDCADPQIAPNIYIGSVYRHDRSCLQRDRL